MHHDASSRLPLEACTLVDDLPLPAVKVGQCSSYLDGHLLAPSQTGHAEALQLCGQVPYGEISANGVQMLHACGRLSLCSGDSPCCVAVSAQLVPWICILVRQSFLLRFMIAEKTLGGPSVRFKT